MDSKGVQNEPFLTAQVVSTGDEVLTGAVVDSNSAFVASRLFETGFFVTRHTTVGDDAIRLRDLLAEIGGQSDIAVVTGGLGPTVDDITARAAAEAGGVQLVQNEDALASIESFFRRFNRPMSPSDRKQAFLPEGADAVFNRSGTAPGFTMTIGKCAFFFLPGVPREMKNMMTEMVIPAIDKKHLSGGQRRYFRERQISLFGLSEAEVNQRLAPASETFGDVKLGMLARFPVITVKLSAFGRDPEQMDRRIGAAYRVVEENLGEWIFSGTGKTIEAVVANRLKQQSATVAVAESCTGGMISDRLTDIPGSSGFFLLSAVCYANSAKTGMIGVSPETIGQFGAVSEETAKEMAAGVRRVANAGYGIATTGIAGPDGGTGEKPVGTVCAAVAGPDRIVSKKRIFPFRDRRSNKEIFAHFALDMLRRELLASSA